MSAEGGFAGRRVLVTGASGFLGRHLTRRLARDGAMIHAVSRGAGGAGGVGGEVTDEPRWWRADLTDYAQVQELLGAVRPHVVFHLSGHVTAAPDAALVVPTFQSLVTSTVHVLTAALRLPCERVLLAGSLAEPAAGAVETTTGSPYVAAKQAANVYARMFQTLYRAPVVITHLAYTYGPGQDASKLIPYVMRTLLSGCAPRLTSGELRADWAYVDDIIEGLIAAAVADQAVGRAVDLGSGTLVSVREVVGHLARIVGAEVEPQFGALPDRSGEQFRAAAAAEALELIGWRATTSLERGLRQTLDWYRTKGHENC